MPMKRTKKETAEKLTLEWGLQLKNYSLNLNKKACVKCQICNLACPKDAIKIKKSTVEKDDIPKKLNVEIDFDLDKCNFCGICDIICPYGAVDVSIKGYDSLPVLEKGSFPKIIRYIQLDENSCPTDCIECEDVCPLSLIKVNSSVKNKRKYNSNSSKERNKITPARTKIEIQKDFCPCCRICEFKCPEGLIKVRPIFSGKLIINKDKCPEKCQDCLDVCPISGALFLSKDKKVQVNEIFCTYCGACKIVCPVDEALKITRIKVNHTIVKSGAWNKVLERLTSTVDLTKELKAKGSKKARESVGKRVKLKDVA